MAKITDRADKFAKTLIAQMHGEPDTTTQAEKEATFAKDFMTKGGVKEQRKKVMAHRARG